MEFRTIIVENKDAVGLITLNLKASMNAVCSEMLVELSQALKAFEEEEAIRAVVLKGSDSFFAAGSDMTEFSEKPLDFFVKQGAYDKALEVISCFKKPLISAVSGYAFGGGLELVLMSDIIIASPETRFGFPEVTLGVLPQMGGVGLLINRIGKAKAMDLLLTARHISAQEALECGLISRVVDGFDLFNEVAETAERIASLPAMGVQLIKKAALEVLENKEKSQSAMAKLSLMSADAKEGLSALKENRTPNFIHK